MTYEESVSVRIDRGQYRKLAQRKGETGIPIAEQLRRAIARYLEEALPDAAASTAVGDEEGSE